MTSKVLTGVKDTDLIILSELNDIDLFNICSLKNKYLDHICRDEHFWRKRFVNKFGDDYLFLKSDKTWRNHYLEVIRDTDAYSYSPWSFFGTISWHMNKGFDAIKVWTNNNTRISEIKYVDTFWKNNYYYLNLGNDITIGYDGNTKHYTSDTYFTPRKILEKVSEYYKIHPLTENKFFIGFEDYGPYYQIMVVN